MRIARDDHGVTILAPAKLNLFLEVLARRADGYHDLETLMVAIDVCDQLQLQPRADARLDLTSRWLVAAHSTATNALGDVPTGSDNIVIRALERLRQRAGVQHGATVHLDKRIASAAGLGGASSDAAAALLAANLAWQLHWPLDRLAAVAAELGSDIPFFLGPPAAICRGRGEIIEPLEALPVLDVVVVRPPAGLSTPAVYKACRPATSPASVQPLLHAWRRGDLAGVGQAMVNRLEPAAEQLSPWITRLRDAFAGQGCYGYQMSGSGSSYFGLCRHALHARRVARRIHAGGLGFAYVTRTIALSQMGRGGAQAA